MTFGAPIAFMSKQVRYQWNEIDEVYDKITTELGDQMLVGISFGGTDEAPSFENLTPRVGKFLAILQVSTRHEHAITIECDGRQGYWPRDTWQQPTGMTFNTPGGTTELAMPLSIASVSSVDRVHQALSHVSFVDVCELDENDVRAFAITTDDLEFDYDLIVFRMLPDGLNVDSRLANRVYIPYTSGAGGSVTIVTVDDAKEWFEYQQRWYRFTSSSGSPLVASLSSSVSWTTLVRSQFSHSMTIRMRRSNAIPLPSSSYAVTVSVYESDGTTLVDTFAVTVLSTGEVETNTISLPLSENDLQLWFSVPANARFEYQVYTERTYAP